MKFLGIFHLFAIHKPVLPYLVTIKKVVLGKKFKPYIDAFALDFCLFTGHL